MVRGRRSEGPVLGPVRRRGPCRRQGPDLSKGLSVLLVEDDEGDAFLVADLLLDEDADITLSRCRTLDEAAARLPGDIDCVLLDLGLPDAFGLEALGRVLEMGPSLAVLVLTGIADEYRGIQAVAAGAQDYLVKGVIDGQLLTRAIRYAVERKRADESVRRLYASEVRAAENARLERGLLPVPLMSSHGVEVVSRYSPGRHQSLLGGDFYDVVECSDGSVFVLIGDVAGHGPDEAALGVCLRIAWRTLVLAGVDPDSVFAAMHAVLVSERSSDEVFATVAMARVYPGRGFARFWLAGHPVPLLLHGGATLEEVPDHGEGIALGVVDGMTWPSVEVPVARDTRLLLFTDGLIEGYDGSPSVRLGAAGLMSLIDRRRHLWLDGPRFVDDVLAAVRERNGDDLSDDVALVLMSWAGWE